MRAKNESTNGGRRPGDGREAAAVQCNVATWDRAITISREPSEIGENGEREGERGRERDDAACKKGVCHKQPLPRHRLFRCLPACRAGGLPPLFCSAVRFLLRACDAAAAIFLISRSRSRRRLRRVRACNSYICSDFPLSVYPSKGFCRDRGRCRTRTTAFANQRAATAVSMPNRKLSSRPSFRSTSDLS